VARMRNCPRCNTSIGETLIVCPACDLPNPFSSPTVEEGEAAAPDYVRSSSSASVSTNTSRSRSLAAAGGWGRHRCLYRLERRRCHCFGLRDRRVLVGSLQRRPDVCSHTSLPGSRGEVALRHDYPNVYPAIVSRQLSTVYS